MRNISIVTGEDMEIDWSEVQREWQDGITTETVETPQGPGWIDAYLTQLALQEVK
jgi:hypothetical protein